MPSKVKRYLLAPLCCALLLTSCGETNNPPTASSTMELTSSQNGNSSLVESSSEFIVTDKTTYSTHMWDENVDKMLAYSVGDAATFIPDYKASDYAVSIGKETSQDGSVTITFTDVKCYPVSPNAIEDYLLKLRLYGFVNLPTSGYSYHKASPTDDLIVQYEVVETKDFYYLSIMAYRVENRLAEWPSEVVEAILSYDLPHLEAESYEFYFDPYMVQGSLYCNNVLDTAIATYTTTLRNEGWLVETSDGTYTTLVSSDGFGKITLFNTADAYEDTSLLIRFENLWPYLQLTATLGEDLPKHSNSSLAFEYRYVTSGDNSILTLYYDGATLEDFETYCLSLKKAGYALDTSVESPKGHYESDLGGEIYYAYYVKGDHQLDVLFLQNAGTIAIPVYC